MTRFKLTFSLLAVVGISATSIATESCPNISNARPARLVENEKQQELISDLISYNHSNESLTVIKAEGFVDSDGDLVRVCCITYSGWMTLDSKIRLTRKLKKLNFVPANINGENIRVYIGFTIVGVKSPTGNSATLLMNKLISADRLGYEYTAPQRIPSNTLFPFDRHSRDKVWGEIVVDIDKLGNPSNARVKQWEFGSKRLRDHFVKTLETECFIPGFAGENAVEISYSEVFQRGSF